MELNDIAKYLYEIGQLKRVKRSGWWMAGITDPESIAEHSMRTAVLGYILASLAGADPMKTATMCLFHDTAEARIGDLHRMAKRYVDVEESEERATQEQVSRLPDTIAKSIFSLIQDYEGRLSLEGQLASDADKLECLIQAREYYVMGGFHDTQEWIESCYASLKTDVAKSLADACLHTEPRSWWLGLKKE
jgi:putative hydrolase of HD superfamily